MHEQFVFNLSIDVPDLTAGLRFYGDVFGLEETARPFPTMAVLRGPNLSVCMHEKAAGSESSPGSGALRTYQRHWTPVHLDIHVPRLEPVLQAIGEAGGRIERQFREGASRPTAFCSDPFGNGFCVIAAQL